MRLFILSLAFMVGMGSLSAQRKCNGPMEDFLFRKTLLAFSVMNQGPKFDKAVKAFTASHCLNTHQTRRLAAIYNDAHARLDYACYASSYVLDIQNYADLATLFPSPQMQDQFFSCTGLHQGPPNPIHGYTGRIGCGHPMSEAQFAAIYADLASYSNAFTRMDIAEMVIPRHCFTVDQVGRMAELWSNSFSREDFLELAYGSTYDIDNYVQLQSLFSNSIMRRDFVAWCYAR